MKINRVAGGGEEESTIAAYDLAMWYDPRWAENEIINAVTRGVDHYFCDYTAKALLLEEKYRQE